MQNRNYGITVHQLGYLLAIPLCYTPLCLGFTVLCTKTVLFPVYWTHLLDKGRRRDEAAVARPGKIHVQYGQGADGCCVQGLRAAGRLGYVPQLRALYWHIHIVQIPN